MYAMHFHKMHLAILSLALFVLMIRHIVFGPEFSLSSFVLVLELRPRFSSPRCGISSWPLIALPTISELLLPHITTTSTDFVTPTCVFRWPLLSGSYTVGSPK